MNQLDLDGMWERKFCKSNNSMSHGDGAGKRDRCIVCV